MKRITIVLSLAAVLAMSVVSPAFAATGREYGAHHADHAVTEGGYTGDHNPGANHKGYAGWEM